MKTPILSKKIKKISLLLMVSFVLACSSDSSGIDEGTYVSPSIDAKGKYRKGHIRKSLSTSKNAYKNRYKSKYYYQSKGKYRRKSRKD